jgi:hypothetical protein
MKRLFLLATILISVNSYAQLQLPLISGKNTVGYIPGMLRADSISSVFANIDTATVRTSFPTQRTFGRVGFANGLPYIFNGTNWIRMYGVDTSGLSNRIDLKQNALGYIPENLANKSDVVNGSRTSYPSNKGVYDYANGTTFQWNAPNKTISMVNTVSGLNLGSAVLYGLADSIRVDSLFNVAKPYRVYSAIVSQTGTGNPTVSVLQNTIGEIVWTRTSRGVFTGALSGAFSANKTLVFVTNGMADTNIISGKQADINSVVVSQVNATTGAAADELGAVSLEIRVYP